MKGLIFAVAVAIVVAVVAFFSFSDPATSTRVRQAIGLAPAPAPTAAKSKPICSQVIVPAGDCVPQHLANLPPDPGAAGMLTLEGIDSDRDGVRDDVQRFIAENWGHSERAVVSLMNMAKITQAQLLSADTIDREGAKKLGDEGMRQVSCVALSDEKLVWDQAVVKVGSQIRNTPERIAKMFKFEVMAANQVYELPNASAAKLCGYDPAKLPN